jgi:hypothetical protein
MNPQHANPFGQQSQSTALQRTTNGATQLSSDVGFEEAQGAGHRQGPDEPIFIHFNGHFNGQFNGAFVLPNNMYQQPPAESDAQTAARRAMAKRSSRSFASRISRTRSRKMEVVGRTTKPGITVDTSFARHRGTAPHQVYPQENADRSSGSVKKQGWFGLGRSSTRTRGLGISKGTPEPDQRETPPNHRISPHQPQLSTDHTTTPVVVDPSATKDPKTTESLTALGPAHSDRHIRTIGQRARLQPVPNVTTAVRQ